MKPFTKFTLHNLSCFDQKEIYIGFKNQNNTPPQLEAWIYLLPSLKEHEFRIEEHNWCANKLKNDSVQLHILNRNK